MVLTSVWMMPRGEECRQNRKARTSLMPFSRLSIVATTGVCRRSHSFGRSLPVPKFQQFIWNKLTVDDGKPAI
jgi:hypothetical protein